MIDWHCNDDDGDVTSYDLQASHTLKSVSSSSAFHSGQQSKTVLVRGDVRMLFGNKIDGGMSKTS
jgi:hypothetical protein